jgi:hypothetical protein
VKAIVPVGVPELAATVAVYVTGWLLQVLQEALLLFDASDVVVAVGGGAGLTVCVNDAEEAPRVLPSVKVAVIGWDVAVA